MGQVTVYGLSRSVYTRIVRLALEEKAVPYELEEVEIFGPEGVPTAHLKRHPFGRIPVLQHGRFAVYETTAITRYIDERFSGTALQPSGVDERARMNQVIGILDSYGYRPMVWGIFVQRVRLPMQGKAPNEQTIAEALPVAATCLDVMEAFLARDAFLSGSSYSLADLHAAPMLLYLALAPEGQEMIGKRPAVTQWLSQMRERPSVRNTTTIYGA